MWISASTQSCAIAQATSHNRTTVSPREQQDWLRPRHVALHAEGGGLALAHSLEHLFHTHPWSVRATAARRSPVNGGLPSPGDSYMEGWPIDPPHSLGSRLERERSSHNSSCENSMERTSLYTPSVDTQAIKPSVPSIPRFAELLAAQEKVMQEGQQLGRAHQRRQQSCKSSSVEGGSISSCGSSDKGGTPFPVGGTYRGCGYREEDGLHTARPHVACPTSETVCIHKQSSQGSESDGSKHSLEVEDGVDQEERERSSTGASYIKEYLPEGSGAEGSCLFSAPGDCLHDRYVLLRQLGAGRCSDLWLAVDLNPLCVARQQLLQTGGKEDVHDKFRMKDPPLFVTVKMYRCGDAYAAYALREIQMLRYIRDRLTPSETCDGGDDDGGGVYGGYRPVEFEQRRMNVTHEPQPSNEREASLTTSVEASRRSGLTSPPSLVESRLSYSNRLVSVLDSFTCKGKHGVRHCLVMDVVGTSVEVAIQEMRPHGVCPAVAKSILRSTLEGLALLATLDVVHRNISPESLLFGNVDEDVAHEMENYQERHLRALPGSERWLDPTSSRLPVDKYRSHLDNGVSDRGRLFGSATGSAHNHQRPCSSPLHQEHDCSVMCATPTMDLGSSCRPRDWPRSFPGKALSEVCLWDFGLAAAVSPVVRHGVVPMMASGEGLGRREDDAGTQAEAPISHTRSPMAHSCTAATDCSGTAAAPTTACGSGHETSPSPGVCWGVNVHHPPLTASSRHNVSSRERGIHESQGTHSHTLTMQCRAYRSPESVVGDLILPAYDIWSIGCIAYELITGCVLFHDVMRRSEAICRRTGTDGATGASHVTLPSRGCSPSSTEVEVSHHGHVSAPRDAGPLPRSCYFDEEEKNVDVDHLKAIMRLIGPPPLAYLCRTPAPLFVREFYDEQGNYLHFGRHEEAEQCGYTPILTYRESELRHDEASRSGDQRSVTLDSEVAVTNLPSISPAPSDRLPRDTRNYRIATSAWCHLKQELKSKFTTAKEAEMFESFLLQCLQWDPSQRSTAEELLRSPWLLTTTGEQPI